MVIHVEQVFFEPSLPSQRIPALDLGKPGDARQHVMSSPLPLRVQLQIFRQKRTRPDQAHFAAKNVPDFWKLI